MVNVKNEQLPKISSERKYSPMDRSLRRELKSTFGTSNYWFSTTKYEDLVEIKLDPKIKLFKFYFLKKKLLHHQ